MPSFTINCPADKWPERRRLFLKGAPNQLIDTSEYEKLSEEEKVISDNKWISHKILLMVKGVVAKGFRIEQEEQEVQFTDDAFTIT